MRCFSKQLWRIANMCNHCFNLHGFIMQRTFIWERMPLLSWGRVQASSADQRPNNSRKSNHSLYTLRIVSVAVVFKDCVFVLEQACNQVPQKYDPTIHEPQIAVWVDFGLVVRSLPSRGIRELNLSGFLSFVSVLGPPRLTPDLSQENIQQRSWMTNGFHIDLLMVLLLLFTCFR